MVEPWLSIVGLGEDGLCGVGEAARTALDRARFVFGGPRHLALAQVGERGRAWPVPFDVRPVLALRGEPVAVLASGDPFWFGVGGTLAAQLVHGEWRAFPALSTFSLAASRLAWRLENVQCFGLHAAPFAQTRSALHIGARLLCLLRDGQAVLDYAQWLTQQGFGASVVWLLEALGGPRERLRQSPAHTVHWTDIQSPVAVAVEVAGTLGIQQTPGLPNTAFTHDGQILSPQRRAMSLCALAPRPGEHLWDLNAGSGSVSVEWCLSGGTASAVVPHADRIAQIMTNAASFGLDRRLDIHHGQVQACLPHLPVPDAIFVESGFDLALFHTVRSVAPKACRWVVQATSGNDASALLQLYAEHGGTLHRFELSQATAQGQVLSWQPDCPLTQWSVVL
jgi:precorrin-6B C5,15-methyltransferase / cobalt-precorrin-6B C5,C15-methyltransferase